MGLSFRKSIQILPGVKLNISKSGLSVSTGIKGLHASINTKGQIRGTASIPGTGVRYTKTAKLSNLIPGMKDEKADKKKPAAENAGAAGEEKPKAGKKTESAGKQGKGGSKEKLQLAQSIIDIYAIADRSLDWVAIKNAPGNLGYENWDYLKARAPKVLDGDIDTYLEIINDINPFAELIELGSEFECGTDSAIKMSVLCSVNSGAVLGEYKDDKELLADYVAGTAIKSARDLFAILPLWQVEITCTEAGSTVLHVDFSRDSFDGLDFDSIDASDTVKKLGGIIAV